MAAVASSTSLQPATGSTPSDASVPVPEPAAEASDPTPTVKSEAINSASVTTDEVEVTAVKEIVGEAENTTQRVNPRDEWIDKERPTFCKVCDFQAQTTEGYQIHNITVRHVKRVIEVFNVKLPNKEEKKEVKQVQFHCQVCIISCNSESAWNSHLIGQKHRKALEKQGAEVAQQKLNAKAAMPWGYGTQHRGAVGMRGGGVGGGPLRGAHHGPGHRQKPYEKPMHTVQQPNNSNSGPLGAKDFAQYGEPLIGLEYVTEIQVVGQGPRYHCELCDSKFDHNLKFPHLVGAKHRFNVLKEKTPQVAQEIRIGVKKRSELSARLLEEAQKLENTEGRKQVKARVENSPFSKVNAMGTLMGTSSHSGQHQRGRGGGTTRGRGGGTTRGRAGGATRGRGGASMRGNVAPRGNSSRGGIGRGATNNQSFRGRGRGANQYSGRGGRGRGQGRGGQGHQQDWQQQFAQDHTPNQTLSATSGYSSNSTSYVDSCEHMLPKEALRPRSPPRSTKAGPYYSSFEDPGSSTARDLEYDMYYGRNDYENRDRYAVYSQYDDRYGQRQVPETTALPTMTQQHSSSPGATRGTDQMMGNLKGALGDLSKLVSTEEDASMALQVSNALTQALLSFRIQNMAEGGAGGVADSSGVQVAGQPGGPP